MTSQLVFGFGFDANRQLSSISKKSHRIVLQDGNIVNKPLEIDVRLRKHDLNKMTTSPKIVQCQTKNTHEENNTIPRSTAPSQIKIVSITWDSILFIYDDGTWFMSGFRSLDETITRLPEQTMPVSSGCLMWDSLILVSSKGASYRITTEQGFHKINLDQKESFLHLDDAKGVSHVVSGGKHCFALTDSQRVASLQKQQDLYIMRPVSLHVAIKQLSCGKEHTILLSRIGAVFTLGIGGQGQLGHGDIENHEEPVVVEALQGVTMATVSAGGWHSVALSDIGDIYIWGWNERGQLGFPSKTRSNDRQQSGNEEPKSTTDNQLHDGQNEYVNILTLPAVLDVETGSEVSMSKISCGSRHTAAITESGQLYTWGWNKYGQLGHGDTEDQDQPRRVEFFIDKKITVTDVYCGYWNTVVTSSAVIAT